MAKDDRLYARFDIGMDEHAKVMLLTDTAFRALIEATLYARRQLTDGFLAEGVVVKKWGRDVAPELTTNHPERPSWVRVEGGWQIRDYDKHQTTNADIESKREAGRLGGMAKAKRFSSGNVAPATEVLEQKGSTNLAKTETETETKTPSSTKKKEAATRGTRVDPKFAITPGMREWAKTEVPLVNLNAKLSEWVDYWASVPGVRGVKLDWEATWRNGMRKQQEFAVRDGAGNTPVRNVRKFVAHKEEVA